MVHQRRLMLFAGGADEQTLFRRIGADGALPTAKRGDVLSVSTQNLANNKIDAYLRRSITYRSTVDPEDGQVRARLVIRLVTTRRRGPPVDRPRQQPGSAVRNDQMTLTVHSSLGLRNLKVDDREVGALTGKERGLQTYLLPVVDPWHDHRGLRPGRRTRPQRRLPLHRRAPAHGPSRHVDRGADHDGRMARPAGRRGVSCRRAARRTRLHADPFDQVESVRLRLER